MKALILNSGMGKRLRPFTDKNPKCFARLNGHTILKHQIENILHYGIKNFVITTGHCGDKIKKFMGDNFPYINVSYAENPKYDSTNAIYSMWLTRGLIDDDILHMHGDMVFERRLLGKLLKPINKNCVLVNNKIKDTKDFKCRIKNNIVNEIGVNVSGENTFFLPPVYKFSKDGFDVWMKEIEKFIKEGKVNVYAEDAFNNIANKINLYPVYYQDEFCMEIDDFNDLRMAREFFSRQKH